MTAAAFTGCGGGSFSATPADAGPGDGAGGDALEAGLTEDAGQPPPVDGGGPGDATGPSRWCDGQHTMFCEDFDRPGSLDQLLASWTSYQQTNGTFDFDTSADVPSPPRALRVSGSSGAQVVLVQEFPGLQPNVKRARLELEVSFDDAAAVGLLSSAGFMAIAMGDGVSGGYVGLAITTGPGLTAGWTVGGDAGASDAGGTWGAEGAMGGFPQAGKWAGRFAIEIDYGTGVSPACAQVYQGVTPLLAQCMKLSPELSAPTALGVVIGDLSGGTNNTGYIQLRFDNVTFDVSY